MVQGWPRPKGHIQIKKGQEVLVTTDEGVARNNILPMEYAEFDKMCKAGDTLFVGRYLTNGADISSVYLDVEPSPLLSFSHPISFPIHISPVSCSKHCSKKCAPWNGR